MFEFKIEPFARLLQAAMHKFYRKIKKKFNFHWNCWRSFSLTGPRNYRLNVRHWLTFWMYFFIPLLTLEWTNNKGFFFCAFRNCFVFGWAFQIAFTVQFCVAQTQIAFATSLRGAIFRFVMKINTGNVNFMHIERGGALFHHQWHRSYSILIWYRFETNFRKVIVKSIF